MKRERWDEIKELIHKNYDVEYEDTESLDAEPGSREVIEFDGPVGFMRLEYVTKPKETGRRSHTAARAGSMLREEVLYSTTEEHHYLNAFKWDDAQDDWVEMEKHAFE